MLDYGCGRGTLVQYLRERGIEAVGYDPSPAAVALARKSRTPVFTEIPAGPYDLVMFWHSLEHTDDPLAAVRTARSRLLPGGKLLIAVPNAASWEAKIAHERWFHYDYPFHRVHFTPRALRLMLERAGFRVRGIDFFNPEYTLSGLVQTFLNFFLPKNVLYSVVSHRRMELPRALAILISLVSLVLVLLFAPVLLTVFFLALLFKKTGAIAVIADRIA